MTKQEIRKNIRQLKSTYTPEELTELSHQLCAKVLQLPQWRKASTVLLYNSLPDEVQTQDLIQAARREHKRIFLPVVVGDDLILREDTGHYTPGPFGILEPIAPQPPKGESLKNYSTTEKSNVQDISTISSPRGGREGAVDEYWLAIIPGMAFDHNNNRLGRGKGYYDRLLHQLNISNNSLPLREGRGGSLIGLCFPFQYIPTILTEPHDIPMDIVIH